jgi:hypothetical protein
MAQQPGLPRIDAQMLLLHALGRAARPRLADRARRRCAGPGAAAFDALCARRLRGEPVAYLTGTKAFHGLTLQVDARVLDPRDDTETLVDWALDLLPADRPRACWTWAPAAAPSPWRWPPPARAPTCGRWTPAPTRWPWPGPTASGWAWP